MPIGYLISVILPALATGLAVAPIRRGWTLGQLSWRAGFQINELPVLAAAWVLASTLLAGVEGDLDTPVGLVGLGVSALTLAGLTLILGRSLRARPAIEAALVETFGPERNRKPGVPDTRSERRPWIRCTLAPLAVRRRDVAHTRNVIYGPAGRYNLLDLYQSRSAVEGAPCLVYLHGGGYRSGKKNREARALLYHLAARGWVCVSANYRLAPTGRYPDQLIDAKRAIAWVGLNAGGYGADPTQIFVAGSSSGAHLAAMAALTANEIHLQPGFEQVDTTVAGAICLYGFYTSPTWIPLNPESPSSPLHQAHRATPPMFVVHGDRDSFVPVNQARQFVNRLRTVAPGVPVTYAELPGAQHTFDMYHSLRFQSVIEGIDTFTACLMPTNRACDVSVSSTEKNPRAGS